MKKILSKASPRKHGAFSLNNSKSKLMAAMLLLKKSCNFRMVKTFRKSKVDVAGIQKFYLQEDISRVLPQRRYATKDGPGYVMHISMDAAHCTYLVEIPTKSVSLETFAALWKRNVHLLSTSHRECCCCVYCCVNVLYKMLCLSRALNDPNK